MPGLEAAINLTQADFLRTPAPAPSGIIVSNLPYGVRLDELDMLAAFYPQLGDWLKREMAGWTAYVLTADLRLAKMVRLSPSKRTPLRNASTAACLKSVWCPAATGATRRWTENRYLAGRAARIPVRRQSTFKKEMTGSWQQTPASQNRITTVKNGPTAEEVLP